MKKEDKLFFLGLLTLTLSLFLIPFGFYLLPAAWFGWQYSIPEFILNFTLWMQVTFHTTYGWAFVWVARLIFLPGIFFGIVAYSISRRLNKMKLEVEEHTEMSAEEEELAHKASEKLKEETKDSLMLMLKIAGIAALIFVIANAMQMVISVTPPR
jgi:membrane protein insertase Oxa1/YidC/SpoIIIJ